MSVKKNKVLVLTILLAAALVGISSWWNTTLNIPGPLAQETQILIPKGTGVARIARILEQENVISSPMSFRMAAKFFGVENRLQAGAYKFQPKQTLNKVLFQIAQGDVIQFKITVPEGMTTAKILDKIRNINGMEGTIPPALERLPEGSLLPETYAYTWGQPRAKLIERMKTAMDDAIKAAWKKRTMETDFPLISTENLRTLASIVEKEALKPEEKQEIAGVYINRLKKGMRLQADPTVIYGASNYTGDITRRHLQEDHPYNTYVHKGLPPGPIANPGKDTLMATANPTKHDYLFFVADGKGGHVFSKTLAQHEENVQAYLKIYKEAQRRSD